MPDADQASLLEIAQKLPKGEKQKKMWEKPKEVLTVFVSGILAGWCLSIFLVILFIKLN